MQLTSPPSSSDDPSTTAAEVGARLGLAPLTGFRADIQVLRGVAVLLVVLYHADVLTPGGFVGVDVFFVISGYVIGRRLVARFATTPTTVMGEFYLHRARRILPALSVLLVTVILTAPLLAPITTVRTTTRTGIAATLLSANYYLYQHAGAGYFDFAAEHNALLHTWSLSVEEQFYLVIPVLLLAAWLVGRRRLGSLRSLRLMIGAVLAASFALCVVMSRIGTVGDVQGLRFAFYSPVTRAWEFAAGLALVVLPARWCPGRRLRPALLVAGAALLAYAAFLFRDTMRFPGTSALIPVVGAVLLVHAGARATGARAAAPRALRPAGFLGDVSYSWYLWHWPLIVYAAALWPDAGRLPLVAAAVFSLLPAWWSYRWIERRLRATPSSRGRPTAALAVACIAAPLVAAVVAIPIRHVATREAESELGFVAALTAEQPGQEATCNRSDPYGSRATPCVWGDERDGGSVVLVGDSNAGHFSNALIGAARADDARLEIATFAGCPFVDLDLVFANTTNPVVLRSCTSFVRDTLAALAADPPDVVVISLATDAWTSPGQLGMVDPVTGDVVRAPAGKARLVEDALARMVEMLRAAGSQVVLVDVVPKPYGKDVRRCSSLAILLDPDPCLPDEFSLAGRAQPATANALQARAATRGGATTWSFTDDLCPHGTCRALRHGHLVWRDPGHISGPASAMLIPSAARQLRATLAAAP